MCHPWIGIPFIGVVVVVVGYVVLQAMNDSLMQ